jgi:hypothetical protein
MSGLRDMLKQVIHGFCGVFFKECGKGGCEWRFCCGKHDSLRSNDIIGKVLQENIRAGMGQSVEDVCQSGYLLNFFIVRQRASGSLSKHFLVRQLAMVVNQYEAAR